MKIAVIGAGMIGVSIAAEAAARGAEVTLIDKRSPGSGTSSLSYGWVNSNNKDPQDDFELDCAGMDAHYRLAADGADWFTPTGHVEFATPPRTPPNCSGAWTAWPNLATRRKRSPPGARITAGAMAQKLGISRATVRQALNTLVIEGLLVRNPATRVLEVTSLDAQDISEIYRARRVLEPAGVEASRTATSDELELLKRAVDGMREAVQNDDVLGFVQADSLCHARTVGFLRSQILSQTHEALMTRLRPVTTDWASTRNSADLCWLARLSRPRQVWPSAWTPRNGACSPKTSAPA